MEGSLERNEFRLSKEERRLELANKFPKEAVLKFSGKRVLDEGRRAFNSCWLAADAPSCDCGPGAPAVLCCWSPTKDFRFVAESKRELPEAPPAAFKAAEAGPPEPPPCCCCKLLSAAVAFNAADAGPSFPPPLLLLLALFSQAEPYHS